MNQMTRQLEEKNPLSKWRYYHKIKRFKILFANHLTTLVLGNPYYQKKYQARSTSIAETNLFKKNIF